MLKVGFAFVDLDAPFITVHKIEKVDKDYPSTCTADTERVFGKDMQPQVLYDGQHIGKHDSGTRRIQSELSPVGRITGRLVKCDLEVLLGICCHHMNKIIRTLCRRKLLTKRCRKTVTPVFGSRKPVTLSVSILKHCAQFIRPGSGQLLDL